MIFLTIIAEIDDNEHNAMRIQQIPSLENLAGLDPIQIGACAVLSDTIQKAMGMIMEHSGGVPQPMINAIGGDSEHSEN